MVYEAFRIFCHCLDCHRATARQTPSHATIIKGERLVVTCEIVDLRLPGATHNSDALDEQHWRASPCQSVMKPNISAVQKFAVIHLRILILNEQFRNSTFGLSGIRRRIAGPSQKDSSLFLIEA